MCGGGARDGVRTRLVRQHICIICTCEYIHGCVLIHVCARSGDFVCIYVLGVQIMYLVYP